MASVTDLILSRTKRLSISPEVTPGNHRFSMFNDAGTEVEVSEFLYSFVKMTKPLVTLETGTHIGVSSTFIAQACEENGQGLIKTFEIIPVHAQNAARLWQEVGVAHRVQGWLHDALKWPVELDQNIKDNGGIDFLFLDSEPQLRFDEFIKFWPYVKPGAFIAVHDLHPSLGHHGQTYHGTYDWPYGDFRDKLGPYIKNHEVQTISFATPRGFTLFQKTAPGFAFTEYLKDEL